MNKNLKKKIIIFSSILFLVILILVVIFYRHKKPIKIPKEYELFYKVAINTIPKKIDLGYTYYNRKEPIPKKIYRLWCNKEPKGNCSGRIAEMNVIDITQKNLPDWEQIIYGDEETKNFLYKEFGESHIVTQSYYLINHKYQASRADLIRLLIIFKYGGLYLDMKSCVIKGPLPEMPCDKDMWVSGWGGNKNKPQSHIFPNIGEYQNWYIYARKGCLILKDIIERIVYNIYTLHNNKYVKNNLATILETEAKGIVLSTTGPIAMTIAIISSNNKDTVLMDTNINEYLKYNCNKNTTISSSHYSKQIDLLVKPNNKNYIPTVIYMTYYDLKVIPKYVKDNIYKYCEGYDIQIYDDEMCLNFLSKYYGQLAVNIFNNMKNGAHKSIFWRFCILYLFGGFYFDIKTVFQKPINKIFNKLEDDTTWYTVIATNLTDIYNGIIVTPSHNPILLEMIKYIYNNPKPSQYNSYINMLYKILSKNCINNKIHIGNNLQKNGWNCVLFQEECKTCKKRDQKSMDKKVYDNSNQVCDRYNLNCVIKDETNNIIFNTRYNDFPWK